MAGLADGQALRRKTKEAKKSNQEGRTQLHCTESRPSSGFLVQRPVHTTDAEIREIRNLVGRCALHFRAPRANPAAW